MNKKQLKNYPILHCFVAKFIKECMPEVSSSHLDIFKKVGKYKVIGYCKCGECGTFYLKAPKKNYFSLYERKEGMMYVSLGEHMCIPKTYKGKKYIDFEVISGFHKSKTYPYFKELFKNKRNIPNKIACKIIDKFFKANPPT